MTEQEQIEKWREDFEQWASKPPREFNLVRHSNGGSWPGQYFYYSVQCAWEAWCEAKRNMPVIELPDIYYEAGKDMDGSYFVDDIHSAIISAGYQYNIKGE